MHCNGEGPKIVGLWLSVSLSEVYVLSFQWATRAGNKMPCNRHALVFFPAKNMVVKKRS